MNDTVRVEIFAATPAVAFSQLLAWEWRHVGRSPLLWTALLMLLLSFCWGVSSTVQLHREQSAAQAGALGHQQQRAADTSARVERFKQIGPELPYWQDPTSVTGYAHYFMVNNGIKPHLPLSALAVGGSDLQPHTLPVKLDTLFGIAPLYDFENPRGLGLGAFDLAFAVTYLLPLLLIAVVTLLGTFERDRGLLRLIAAQSVSPRQWLGARMLAITGWLLPALVLALPLALILNGVALRYAVAELAMAMAVLVVYALFWIALAFVVLSRWPSAPAAMSLLTAGWLILAFGAPVLVDLATSVASPPPSRIAYVDRQRQVIEALTANRDQLLAEIFAARPDLAHATARIPSLDGVSRNSFFTPEIERQLAPLQAEFDGSKAARNRGSSLAGYLLPPLGVAEAFTVLAGTDAERHQQFEAQLRAYQLQLRDWFYPLIQREITTPTPRAIAGSMGRFNFARFGEVPRMHFVDRTVGDRVSAVLPVLLWLLILSALLTAVAYRRLRTWPAEL